MYIRHFEVRNYLVHKQTSMALSPLTVFVGPNGGGKSAFFDAMLNFSMLCRGNLRQAFGPFPYSFHATLHRGASKISRIGYKVSISKGEQEGSHLCYEIDYSQTEGVFTIFTEILTKEPGNLLLFDRSKPDLNLLSKSLALENDRSLFSALRQRHVAGQETAPVDDLLLYCTQRISQFNKFRLDPGILAQPSRLPEIVDAEASAVLPPRLGYNGEDLAATLYHLNEASSPVLDILYAEMKEIYPEFSSFEFNTIGTDRIGFSVVYSDSRQSIPAVRLSAGMLIYIGLMVLVLSPNRPAVLMIEEPENGLTPQALKSFYEAVRNLAYSTDPDKRSQVLISSHSPFVICEAWNGEDRDFIHQMKVVDGVAHVRKFADIVEAQGIHLGKNSSGDRTHLSLPTAEQVMSGYWS